MTWVHLLGDAEELQRLGPITEIALADDQASFNPEDLSESRVELNPAPSGSKADLAREGDDLARVDDLERRVVEDLPGLA
jgi:hypothetical protein